MNSISKRGNPVSEQDSNKTIYWIAGIIGSALIALFSIVYGGLSARIDKMEENGTPKSREEISMLKADIRHIKENLEELKMGQREMLSLLKKAQNNDNQEIARRR